MSTINKEEILDLIKDMFDVKFKQHEATIIKFIGDNNKLLFDKLDDINRKITDHELRLAEVEEITKDLERSLTVTQDIEDEKIKNNDFFF